MRGRNDPALEAKWRCLNLNRGTVADPQCDRGLPRSLCDETLRAMKCRGGRHSRFTVRLMVGAPFGSCLIIPVKELISPTAHNRENVPYRAEGAARVDWD